MNDLPKKDPLEQALNEAGFQTVRLDKASVRQGPTWECKIGLLPNKSAVLPGGADAPMRKAVQETFEKMVGQDSDFIFSGWGAHLTPVQMEVVTGSPRDGQSGIVIIGYHGPSDAKPVTLLLSDGSKLLFDPAEFKTGGA